MDENEREVVTMVLSRKTTISWVVYIILLFFRVIVCPFQIGYVHPDEFFQGGQELFFGCPPTIPWEFEPINALRSIIPPTFMTWFPLQIYDWLRTLLLMIIPGFADRNGMAIVGMGSFSGMEVLIIPRIFCSMLSILIVDWSVWSIYSTTINTSTITSITIKNTKENRSNNNTRGSEEYCGVPIAVLLLASAWPTMVMLTRPFSNSMESFILALLMATVITNSRSRSNIDIFFCLKIGTICAVGIFTRFTFVFFAFPILLFLLYGMIQKFGLRKTILWRKLSWMIIFFAFTSLGIVLIDTQFYSSRTSDDDENQQISLFNFSSLVLTPLNALTYNSKISNLKEHGIHPRWTHAVVNMMIMFGPLTLTAYLSIPATVRNATGGSTTVTSDTGTFDRRKSKTIIEKTEISMIYQTMIVLSLGFLSIAPHQEPRFLLPLIIPLVLLGEKCINRFPTIGTFVWILFNMILFVLFGVLHQGGVSQSLLSVGSTAIIQPHQIQPTPTSWIYWRTYMPPTFLTRLSRDIVDDTRTCSSSRFSPEYNDGKKDLMSCEHKSFGEELDDMCQKEKVRIVDLNGSSFEKLWNTIQTELPCSKNEGIVDQEAFLFLVVPFLAENDGSDDNGYYFSYAGQEEGRCQLPNETYECNHVSSYGPHLTTEDFPPYQYGTSATDYYNGLVLNVYNISCTTTTI